MPIGWTKQQDFCLRLGLLKALVAVLPSQRRSVGRDVILRKLDQVLFSPAKRHAGLQLSASRVLGAEMPPDATIADALLMTSTCSSWGQPIDSNPTKISKILEWGHNAGLMAGGNQITERGLLLRSFFEEEEVVRFLAGDASAWNPFSLSRGERGFFFYSLPLSPIPPL